MFVVDVIRPPLLKTRPKSRYPKFIHEIQIDFVFLKIMPNIYSVIHFTEALTAYS